jgi:hypothetical protein
MGTCGSKPKVSDDLKVKKINNNHNHRRKRRRILRRRISSHKIEANIAHTNSGLQASNRASGIYFKLSIFFFLLMFDPKIPFILIMLVYIKNGFIIFVAFNWVGKKLS